MVLRKKPCRTNTAEGQISGRFVDEGVKREDVNKSKAKINHNVSSSVVCQKSHITDERAGTGGRRMIRG